MTSLWKGGRIMNNLQELSGNIKLRLPKSLHAALVRQSKYENVSLNQLCLMYLSTGISSNNLGTEEFNHRLELIAIECRNDEKKLFERLTDLNDEVEAIKPFLLQELKIALDDNKRQMNDFIETLRYIYPVYHGDWVGEKLPMLKVPSAKIALRPNENLYLDIKEISNLVGNACSDAIVAYGDYDFYVPMDLRLSDKSNLKSIAINICCKYQDLENNIRNIKSELNKSTQLEKLSIEVKPCYLQEYTSFLLKEKYGSI